MSPEVLTLSTVVSRKPDLPVARLDDETVLLDVQSGAYYGYDATAGAIWELLEAPRTVAAVCGALVERYDVGAERCQAEVLAFLGELSTRGLLRTHSDDSDKG